VNRNYLIVIGLGVATIIAFLLINYFSQQPAAIDAEDELKVIQEEMESLDDAILELEIINETYSQQMVNLKNLLDEKYTQLNMMENQIEQMENKVDELERKGALDDETIQELREKLRKASGRLLNTYRQEINLLVVENSRITAAMDSALMEVNNSDSIILALTRQNEQYEKGLLDCQDAQSMEEVNLPQVAQLTANNFTFSSVAKDASANNNKVLENADADRRRPRLSLDKLERLKVCFDLTGNSLVKSGNKKVYLYLTNSYGTTYTSSNLSGQAIKNGVTSTFTRASEVNYQKLDGSYNVCMDFVPDEGENFNGGTHTVEIVYDGKVIGTKKFWVKK